MVKKKKTKTKTGGEILIPLNIKQKQLWDYGYGIKCDITILKK